MFLLPNIKNKVIQKKLEKDNIKKHKKLKINKKIKKRKKKKNN